MALKVYNTLARGLEEFQPRKPKEVLMYVCGITPYDETHLGHARAYVTFDVIRRYLEFKGFKVKYVQNITDVDDKIIKKSEIRNPKSETNSKSEIQNLKQRCREITEKYIRSYFEVMDRLNVRRASRYPRATEEIGEMIKIVEELVKKGFAYELDDGIYFEVAKFKEYGKLSHRKMEDLETGARVKVQVAKKNPFDFVLWKKAKEGEPSWDSPWGPGRPGWHLECSAMASKYLGKQFDIHGGGLDLVFPHHENEIAQSECAFGKVPWVRYWIHNGFVTVNREKMSKSLGNFFTLKDIYKKFNPMAVRIFLLGTHYRGPINFSDEQLKAAGEAFRRLQRTIEDVEFYLTQDRRTAGLPDLKKYEERFIAAMDDDFNTAQALALIFDLATLAHKKIKAKDTRGLSGIKKLILKLADVLGLSFQGETKKPDKKVQSLIAERETARKNKDFKRADQIRDKLKGMGIVIEDTVYGTKIIN